MAAAASPLHLLGIAATALGNRSEALATTAATEAFQKRDYQRVIELLEPFADVLTRAERAKLAYARRHG